MREVEELGAGIRRLTAPNPGPMTHQGTQSYLLGCADVAIVDPGPDDPAHLAALADAAGPRVAAIIVTHAHLDHSAGAAELSRMTGAPVHAFGPAGAGRSDRMEALAARFEIGGGEGVDHGFRPDHLLADGTQLEGADWQVEAIHTPGHMSNHLCLALPEQGVILSGDHVMGWSSTLISPPDGNLTDFMGSLERLLDRPETRYLPGHGDLLEDGKATAAALAAHRRMREGQILAELEEGAQAIPALVRRIYPDLSPGLVPAAERNVLAHVLDLMERGIARLDGDNPLRDPVARRD